MKLITILAIILSTNVHSVGNDGTDSKYIQVCSKVGNDGTDNKVGNDGTDNKVGSDGTDNKVGSDGTDNKQFCTIIQIKK